MELVAVAVPRLRWRRHDVIGRIRLRQAVAVLAVALLLLKGYSFARYLERNDLGYEAVPHPGLRFELLAMVTFAAGGVLLAMLAGIISVHGLANGYAVLLVSDWLLDVIRLFPDEAQPSGPWLDRARAFGLAVLVAMMLITWCMLRWRVRGSARELDLRVPSSSISPLADVWSVSAALGVTGAWLAALHSSMLPSVALMIPFVAAWSWVFARPALLARATLQASLAPPSRVAWWRAMLLSAGGLAALALLGNIALAADDWNNLERGLRNANAAALADPVMAMIATAVLLDIVDGARAHRERLVAVAELHQIQHAGIVERVLARANIHGYIHAANVHVVRVPRAVGACGRDGSAGIGGRCAGTARRSPARATRTAAGRGNGRAVVSAAATTDTLRM